MMLFVQLMSNNHGLYSSIVSEAQTDASCSVSTRV